MLYSRRRFKRESRDTQWTSKYNGKNIVQGYGKWFGVDLLCAVREPACSGFPLAEKQVRILKNVDVQMDALSKSFSADILSVASAEAKLDDFLSNETSSPRRVIPEYLRQLVEVRGKSFLPGDVAEWLAKIPLVPVPKHEVYSPQK